MFTHSIVARGVRKNRTVATRNPSTLVLTVALNSVADMDLTGEMRKE